MQQLSNELHCWALVWILVTQAVCGVSASHAQTIDSLGKLDNGGRFPLIKAAFEKRMEQMNNADITSTARIANYEFHDGRLGKQVGNLSRYQFHLLRLGGSYRLEAKWYLNENTAPEITSTDNFIEKDGLEHGFSTSRNVPHVDGIISTVHKSGIMEQRVMYLLDGSFAYITPPYDEKAFLFQSLVKAADKWNVEVDPTKGLAIITHPYQYPRQAHEGPVGVRKVYCDISKGFLPTRIEVDWKDDKLAKGAWREERIVMDRCALVDGLWMPMRIEERIRASTGDPSVCSVFLTEITDVALGKVKEDSLKFVFPPKTRVVDVTKGIYYTVGDDGQSLDGVARIGSVPGSLQGSSPPARSPERRWSMIVTTVLLVCLIGVFVLRRWRRRR